MADAENGRKATEPQRSLDFSLGHAVCKGTWTEALVPRPLAGRAPGRDAGGPGLLGAPSVLRARPIPAHRARGNGGLTGTRRGYMIVVEGIPRWGIIRGGETWTTRERGGSRRG